jgi:hypothetical protein
VLLSELRKSLESDMKGSWPVELGKVGDEELWCGERFAQGFLLGEKPGVS